MNLPIPTVYALMQDKSVRNAFRGVVRPDIDLTLIESPLELIALCSRRRPMYIAVHLAPSTESWLSALEVLLEQAHSPRMLLLTEPGVLDETMHSVYRDGRDHLLLWPATPEQLLRSTDLMFRPGGGCNRHVGLVPGGPHDSGW